MSLRLAIAKQDVLPLQGHSLNAFCLLPSAFRQ